jgi:hypothetical protein
MLRVWLVVIGLVVSGCAARQLGRGAPSWRLVTTEHFRLYTDLPEEHAVERAEDFERWLAAYQQHGWSVTGRLPLALNVVVFRNEHDFGVFGGDDIGGYFTSNVLFEPWVVMPDGRNERTLEVFRHELTHFIANLAIYDQPAWFAEGLATYFQTARFDERGRFTVGAVPGQYAVRLVQRGIRSSRSVFAAEARRDAGFYANSWLIVHYLISELPEQFEAYQLALAKGLGHEAAWARAFPELPPEKLDERLHAYWEADAFARWTREVNAPRGQARVRALSTADEHALRAILWSGRCADCSKQRHMQRQVKRIVGAYQAALAADRTQPQATAWLVMNGPLSKKEAGERADELARAHPEAWLAWAARGIVAMRSGALGAFAPDDDPVTKLRQIAPDHPYTHMLAAFQHAQRGERELAIRASGRAQRISKANPELLQMQAELFASLSACPELHETVTTLNGLGHGDGPDAVQRAQLAKLERGCTQK